MVEEKPYSDSRNDSPSYSPGDEVPIELELEGPEVVDRLEAMIADSLSVVRKQRHREYGPFPAQPEE